MERENVYFEDVPEKNYKAPNVWGICFVDSADNDYTFYPAIIFGDDLQSINESDIRYVFTPDTAFRIGRRLIEYSLRCMYYKKRKRAPKTFKPWFK